MHGPAGYMVTGPAGYMHGPAGYMVAHEILVSAQGPLVLSFWVWGLRVWGLGLTILFDTVLCSEVIISSVCWN